MSHAAINSASKEDQLSPIWCGSFALINLASELEASLLCGPALILPPKSQ
jgi:hypothetical protein